MYTIWINGFCFRSISEFLDSIFCPKKMYGSMKKKIMNALRGDNVFTYEGIAFVVRNRLGAYCGGGW